MFISGIVLFLIGNEKKNYFCSSQTLGLKLANKCVIEEEAGNEIATIQSINVKENDTSLTKDIHELIIKALLAYEQNQDNNHTDYHCHLVWTGDIDSESEQILELTLRAFKFNEPLLTVLSRKPQFITNRDYCINLQNHGGLISGKRTTKSFGDDLENVLNVIQRISQLRCKEKCSSHHFYEMSDDEFKDLDISEKILFQSLPKRGFNITWVWTSKEFRRHFLSRQRFELTYILLSLS